MGEYHEYCTGGFHPDDIVITGIAGRFPQCDNVGLLKEALFAKQILSIPSNERWEKGACGLENSSRGLVRNLDKFDADFFCIPYSTANAMNPEGRKLLEVTYEAIADSGYDPMELKGANIGVYNSNICSDSHETATQEKKADLMSYLHCCLANRSSYVFDFIGPSFSLDSGCSSAATALYSAFIDMKEGRIDGAIVNTCHLTIDPRIQSLYEKMKVISTSGNSRPFDDTTDGFLRSESCTAIFLQKASVARRAYATILSAKYGCSGYVSEGLTVPSLKRQVETSQSALLEAGIQPSDVHYLEAHGTGTQVGDPIELNAIAQAFCVNRESPLNVTSIKGNIGHTEASAASCGIINIIIAYETGMITPHPTFRTPNTKVPALVSGLMKIVTEPTSLTSPYALVNSFGIGGGIGQAVLKQNPVVKSNPKNTSTLPRLVLCSATIEMAIHTVFDYIDSNPELSPDFFALLDQLSFTSTFLKPTRGFGLFQQGKETVKEIQNCTSDKRQVWFIMTGMGCQWPGMGLQLMEIEEFARSMHESAEVLKPFGFDLMKAIHPDTHQLTTDRYVTPAFTGMTAVQIALVDVLRKLGIEPDGIIGHSAGEVAAAYVDGSCDRKQTMLSAYFRSIVINGREEWPDAAMAVVGLPWNVCMERCPEGVFPACDNTEDTVTVSGPKRLLEEFVEELKKENIFARNLYSYGYGFHSPYLFDAADRLLESLTKYFPERKARSSKWISTSFSESELDNPDCRFLGAEYFAHNMLAPVRFREAIQYIPKDAITIEIGPHILLQSLLKRSIGNEAAYIGLMKKDHEDNLGLFFQGIGQLYNVGVDPKIERLYPPVQFPVARGTPMISDLIRWNYSLSFEVPKWSPMGSEANHEFETSREDSYLLEHFIDGRSLFPGAGFFYLAWEAMAEKLQKNMEDVPVIIHNLAIHRATIISQNANVKFSTQILNKSGHFEILEGNSLVASGQIFEWSSQEFDEPEPIYDVKPEEALSGNDVYSELKMQDYAYGPIFRRLHEISRDGSQGLLTWEEKWIPFLDSLHIFFGMLFQGDEFKLPIRCQTIKINAQELRKRLSEIDGNVIPVTYNADSCICRTYGVELTKIVLDTAPRRPKDISPTLEQYRFISYFTTCAAEGFTNKDIDSYMNACNNVIDVIGKAKCIDVSSYKFSVRRNIHGHAPNNDNDIPSNCHLLKSLVTLAENLENLKSVKKTVFAEYARSLGSDFLMSGVCDKNVLNVLTSIVSENCARKLDVVEVAGSSQLVLPLLMNSIENNTFLTLMKCILVCTDDIPKDAELLEEKGIEIVGPDFLKSSEESLNFVIGSFVGGPLQDLEELISSLSMVLKPNKFLLLFYKEKMSPPEMFLSNMCEEPFQLSTSIGLERILNDHELIIVSKISHSCGSSAYLIRKKISVSPYTVLNLTNDNCYSWVEDLKSIAVSEKNKKIWLVADDNLSNGIVGLINCLKQEPGGERVRCVYVPPERDEIKRSHVNFQLSSHKQLLDKDLVMNIFQGGCWGSFRHISMIQSKQVRKVEHSYVHCQKYGDLSSFEWKQSPVRYFETTEKKLVHIYYSALNFKDVMLATGKLSSSTSKITDQLGCDSILGLEFSGRDTLGQRVAGFVSGGGMATAVLARTLDCVNVPPSWSLEEAATMPIVYATCYYALLVRGQLKAGESILVHSATGGIGMAALYIASFMGCEIYATVGNDEKRKYLKRKFPNFLEENIGCSRDTTFEHMIMKRTKGKGVNVVLNSLADDKFMASIRCVSEHGRFIEIGKYDLSLDRPLGLKIFLKNISFHGVFLDALFQDTRASREALKEVMALLKEGLARGVVQPLDRKVFDKDSVEEAFRFMAKGVHVGKVLLKIRDEEMSRITLPTTVERTAIPNTYFYPWKSYVIVGGLGGVGIELTNWMIQRGARNIVLTTRSGSRTQYQIFCLVRWKKAGYNVKVSTLDVSRRNECEMLLKDVASIAPIGGIFNSAVIFKDAFLENVTVQDFQAVCSAKVSATINIDELSRKFCPSLDHFVCFSSISCGKGNAGQVSYGYANSAMERICEDRARNGLPGLAIQWGTISGVGVVHRRLGEDTRLMGLKAQDVKSCMKTLDCFCQEGLPVVCSYVVPTATATHRKTTDCDVLNKIAKVIGLSDVSEVNTTRNFGEMGIDSMISVELKILLESECNLILTTADILNMKMDDFKALIKKSRSDSIHSVKSHPLVITHAISMPKDLERIKPLLSFNTGSSGVPVVVVNAGNVDPMSFQMLADSIANPVHVLSWTKNTPSSDLVTSAAWCTKILRDAVKNSFHLIGYDILGGTLAFEISLQLTPKSLTLLDGTEHLLSVLGWPQQSNDPQVSALCRFVQQFLTEDLPQMKEELEKLPNLEERVKQLMDFFSRSCSESTNKEEMSKAISLHLRKCQMVESYAPKGKLKLNMCLMEDPSILLANDITEIKKLFSQICKGKIAVHRIFSRYELLNKETINDVAAIFKTIFK